METYLFVAAWFISGYVALVVTNRQWYAEFHELQPMYLMIIIFGLGFVSWAVVIAYAISKAEGDKPSNLASKILLWKKETP